MAVNQRYEISSENYYILLEKIKVQWTTKIKVQTKGKVKQEQKIKSSYRLRDQVIIKHLSY